jgi:hypothetical protein
MASNAKNYITNAEESKIKWKECTQLVWYQSIHWVVFKDCNTLTSAFWSYIERKLRWNSSLLESRALNIFCIPMHSARHDFSSVKGSALFMQRGLAPGFSWVIPPAWHPSAARSLFTPDGGVIFAAAVFSHSTFTWCHKFAFMVLRNFIMQMRNKLTKPAHFEV